MGAIAPENVLSNNLWIDVGNMVKDGVCDHHQDGGAHSAFECVVTRADCYESLREYLKEHRDDAEVVIHMHEPPDLDCIFCVYAVQRMIAANADCPAKTFAEPVLAQMLNYINCIDGGLKKCLSKLSLYAYFCKIGSGIKDQQKRNRELVEEGLKAIDLVVKAIESGSREIDLFVSGLEDYLDCQKLKYYSEALESVSKMSELYQQDRAENRVEIKNVNLWNQKNGAMQPVKAAIWREMPSCEDEYELAREYDRCLLTVYPIPKKADDKEEGTRTVIALNPNLSEAQDYSLRPLAEVLEQCEQTEEERIYKGTGRYRRDHSRSRTDDGRFSECLFRETADPWYVSEEEDIIDSPHAYSLLQHEEIRSIIDNDSFMTKAVHILRFDHEGGNIVIRRNDKKDEFREISFGKLYSETRNRIDRLKTKPDTEYLFIYVKVDPTMLRYNHDWLKTCCLNMVGKSMGELSNDNLLYADYRTCIYADQSVAVLVEADGQSACDNKLINPEEICESRICINLRNMLWHRCELRNIVAGLSENIGELADKNEQIDRFNERLVSLSSRIEKDRLLTDPLEQEVYAFLNGVLGIEKLQQSVTGAAQLLVSNAEQLRDRRLQKGLGILSVLVVFSAWVDAFDFIAKFAPGWEDGWTAIWGESIWVCIVEVIAAAFILCALVYSICIMLKSSSKKKQK